jgi:hypothetical protein
LSGNPTTNFMIVASICSKCHSLIGKLFFAKKDHTIYYYSAYIYYNPHFQENSHLFRIAFRQSTDHSKGKLLYIICLDIHYIGKDSLPRYSVIFCSPLILAII